MSRIRISGLVGLAGDVRQKLAGPLEAQQIGQLRDEVRRAIEAVNAILVQHAASPADLPPPSQRAFAFPTGLHFDTIQPGQPSVAPAPAVRPTDRLTWPGLRRYMDGVANMLARASQPPDKIYEGIVRSSGNIERELVSQQVPIEQLTAETRVIRGWLALFANRANFDAYLSALGRAMQAFQSACRASGKFPLPVLVHFRPTTSWYRIKKQSSGTTVWLPTPMICFDDLMFIKLAGLATGWNKDRRIITEAMTGDDFQDIQAELESLGGLVERSAGAAHDLAEAFERVNRDYFGGVMVRPRLVWSRTLTRRKFGHYDAIRDTVMVSATLDQPGVPEFAVDYIVHHELLHKKHGVNWHNGRARVHTPKFKDEDRRFGRYEQADAVLKRLAARRR